MLSVRTWRIKRAREAPKDRRRAISARRGASEKQAGDVRAGDEQNQSNDEHQDLQRLTVLVAYAIDTAAPSGCGS